MWRRMSLSQKMVALIVPIFLLVFAGFGFLGMWTLDQSTQRTVRERLLLAEVTAASIDHYNREVLQQLGELATAVDLRDGDLEPERRLLKNAQSRIFAEEFFLLNREGNVLLTEPHEERLLGLNLSLSGYVGQTYLTGEPFVSGIVPSLMDGRQVVVYTISIKDEEGAVIGALGTGFDLTQPSISGYIEAIKLGKTGYAQVVDGRGDLLASTQPEEVFGKSDHGDRFVTLIQDKKSVVRTCHSCHEPAGSALRRRKDVLAFAPLFTAPWGVAVRQAEEEALAPIRRLRVGMLGVGSLSLLLALGTTLIFVRRLVKPVQMLTVGAQRIAAGDLSNPIEARGKDEIGILAETFEVMRARLRDSREEIERRTQDIESRNLELSALNTIATTVSQSLDLDQTLEATLDKVLAVVGAPAGGILLLEAEGQPMALKVSRGLDDVLNNLGDQWQKGVNLSGEVSYMGQGPPLPGGQPSSFISVPLLSKGKLHGTLAVAIQGERSFEPREIELLTAIGHQIGVAVDNAKLFQETQRREQEAKALYDVGAEISSLLEVDKILDSVVEKARYLLDTEVAFLALPVEEERRLYVRATSGARTEAFTHIQLKQGQGFAGSVMSRGQPLATEDYLADSAISHDKEVDSIVRGEGLRAHLGVPLTIGRRVIGALIVAHRKVYTFLDREKDLLSRLANQAALAIENARLYEEVQRKEELRGQLLEKVISAQEEERKRIARELHDDSAQALTALTMQLEAIEKDLPPELYYVRDRVVRQKISANKALEGIRTLIADLRPTALDNLGLVPAIRWYAENRLMEQGVKVVFDFSGLKSRLPLQLETILFRVFQEAINNIAKHAEACNVRISLGTQGPVARGIVEDDGKGFDTALVLDSRGAGLGFLGMQERISLFEGTLSIQSQPGQGTRIVIEVPVRGGK